MWGAEQTLENGCTSSSGQETGCTDTLETYAYNNRLQPVMIELGTPANPAADYCLVYNDYASLGSPGSCAVPSQGTGDNGNVRGYLYQDNANPSLSHTEAYTYDALNRLTNAVATGSSTYNFTRVAHTSQNARCVRSQYSVDWEDRGIVEAIKPETRPGPFLRRIHKASLEGIGVHVIQFLGALRGTPHIEIVKAALPDAMRGRTMNGWWQSKFLQYFRAPRHRWLSAELGEDELRGSLFEALHNGGRVGIF